MLPWNDFKGPAAPTIGPGTRYCTDQTLSTISDISSSAVSGLKCNRVRDSKMGQGPACTGEGVLRQDGEKCCFMNGTIVDLGENEVDRGQQHEGWRLDNMED